MAEENTPLLNPNNGQDSEQALGYDSISNDNVDDSSVQAKLAEAHNAIYDRFSNARKRVIVSLIAFCGLLPLFVSGSFLPSIPDIARDFDTTGSVVSFSISLSVLAASLGALFGASYSSFYGRKPIYLIGLPLLALGSVGVALSHTVTELMIWRFLQTFGGSPGLAVGAGVIGDIYKLTERGTAMGFFFGACLLGPALAPLVGGILSYYASWRITQIFLGSWGLLAFICIACFFPETSNPGTRGIDKRRAESGQEDFSEIVWINPLKTLGLLRSPNLLAVALAGSAVLLTDFVLLVPLTYTIGTRYGIKNGAALGACFIPIGLGNFLGAPTAGWLSDQIVKRKKKQRGGVWCPEDRLLGTLFASATFVPLSVLGVGLFTHYVPGTLGLILNFICMFFNGMGVDLVLSPSAAYIVDVMHSQSAESMAANNGLRSFLMSLGIATIMPLIEHIGVVWTNALSALIGWIGFGLLLCTVKYGERMRAWVDLGYSTAENN